MAITPSTVIATARSLLQDTVAGGYRYSDADLITAFNMALKEARKSRPDLFLWDGVLNEAPTVTSPSVGTPIAIESQYENSFVLYVVGYAELREDQFTNDGRAATLLGQFKSSLQGA